MSKRRIALSAAMIGGLVAGGCASSDPHDPGMAVARFVPAVPKPDERRVPTSGEYVLWRWDVVPTPNSAGGPPVPVLRAVTVGHADVRRGKPIGFRVRRPDGLLIAVAGPTTRPLPAGRYVWREQPSMVRPPSLRAEQLRHAADAALTVAVVVGLVAAAVAIDSAIPDDRRDHNLFDPADCRPIDAGRPAASNRRRGR